MTECVMHLMFSLGDDTWTACLSNVDLFACFCAPHTHAVMVVTDPTHSDPAGTLMMLQAVNHSISCKPWVAASAACGVSLHRHMTKKAECTVRTPGRRRVDLKPPALAWAWLPENMTWLMYTWGQFSHMSPPPTSPAMQLHSTHGHTIILEKKRLPLSTSM